MKINKNNAVLILGIVGLSFINLAVLMAWIKLSSVMYIILSLFFLSVAYFGFNQDRRKVGWEEAWNKAKPALEKVGVTTQNGAQLDWMFIRKENGEYSNDGNLWDIQGRGNPKRAAVFISRSTGEVMGMDANAENREPPTNFEPKILMMAPKRGKRKVKYDIEEDNQ